VLGIIAKLTYFNFELLLTFILNLFEILKLWSRIFYQGSSGGFCM